jgi:hypothetical protein
MKLKMKKVTPMKAIRAKCLDCCGGQPSEVRKCPAIECPLYRYRFGRNPNRKGVGPKKHFNQKKDNSASNFCIK